MSISPQRAIRETLAARRHDGELRKEPALLEPILQDLRDLEGVHGALIIDQAAGVIAYRSHAIYELAALQQIARSVMRSVDAVESLQSDWEVLTGHFETGKLVLRNLRTIGEQSRRCVLAVVADSARDAGFLGVALRIAASKLIPVLEGVPGGAAPAGAPAAPASAPAAPAAPAMGTPTSMPAVSEDAQQELCDDPGPEGYPWWT
jgi:predicted regulator of Ras-like GTPase activity (Roadblock/LC7/MglB family)